MANLTINAVASMSREERDGLSDEQIQWLSYAIKYFDAGAAGFSDDEAIRVDAIIRDELAPRLAALPPRTARPARTATAPARALLVCGRCGQHGYADEYPFSTLAASGVCDDCL